MESIPLVCSMRMCSMMASVSRRCCPVRRCKHAKQASVLSLCDILQVSGDDLPTHVARIVSLPSQATSCDFHPFLHSLLLGEPMCRFVISGRSRRMWLT